MSDLPSLSEQLRMKALRISDAVEISIGTSLLLAVADRLEKLEAIASDAMEELHHHDVQASWRIEAALAALDTDTPKEKP